MADAVAADPPERSQREFVPDRFGPAIGGTILAVEDGFEHGEQRPEQMPTARIIGRRVAIAPSTLPALMRSRTTQRRASPTIRA